MDPEHIDEFNPESVPTVGQLLSELDDLGKANGKGDAAEHHSGPPFFFSFVVYGKIDCASDWEKTSLKPYVEILDKHALRLMEQSRRDRRGTGSFSFTHSRLPLGAINNI